MPIHPETGCWVPLLSPKQFDIFNTYKRYVLVDGPRRTGKSIGCCHKVLRHCFETDMARVAIFARTRKSAEQGGIFTDLVETVIPEWVQARIGFQVLNGPKIDGATRLLYLDVSNVHGTRSRIQLHSLDYDFDIEAAIRSTRFSMFYFSELSNFKNRIIFTISTEQLRMPHLREDQHQWLADTNPAEEGEESWIYQLFYKERTAEHHPYPTEQAKYQVIHIGLDDNPFISAEEKLGIAARHAHDPDLMNRYYHGLWTRRTETGLFSDVFIKDLHVLGNSDAMSEEDWEVLLPTETCSKMLTGWDPGSSKNHSMHFIEKIGVEGQSHFHVIDEVASLGINLPTSDFTEFAVERLDYWEWYIRTHCHPNPVEWRHWSDLSAFDQYRAALGGYDHTVIAIASDGRFLLSAAPKGKGSVFKRIDILRRLLFQNRLYVSARCTNTIRMLGSICKGKNRLEPVEDSELRHIFDSLSYPLVAECFYELGEAWSPRIGQSPMIGVPI